MHLDTLQMQRQKYEKDTDGEDSEDIESVFSSETDATHEEVRIRVLRGRRLND